MLAAAGQDPRPRGPRGARAQPAASVRAGRGAQVHAQEPSPVAAARAGGEAAARRRTVSAEGCVRRRRRAPAAMSIAPMTTIGMAAKPVNGSCRRRWRRPPAAAPPARAAGPARRAAAQGRIRVRVCVALHADVVAVGVVRRRGRRRRRVRAALDADAGLHAGRRRGAGRRSRRAALSQSSWRAGGAGGGGGVPTGGWYCALTAVVSDARPETARLAPPPVKTRPVAISRAVASDVRGVRRRCGACATTRSWTRANASSLMSGRSRRRRAVSSSRSWFGSVIAATTQQGRES